MSPWLQGPCKEGTSCARSCVPARSVVADQARCSPHIIKRDAHARLEISFAGTRERVLFRSKPVGLDWVLNGDRGRPELGSLKCFASMPDDVAFASLRVAGIFHFAFCDSWELNLWSRAVEPGFADFLAMETGKNTLFSFVPCCMNSRLISWNYQLHAVLCSFIHLLPQLLRPLRNQNEHRVVKVYSIYIHSEVQLHSHKTSTFHANLHKFLTPFFPES